MLKKLQEEHRAWTEHNFGKQPPHHPLLGVVEEVGELSHAHLKEEQSIRNHEPHEEKAKDAVADIVIYLAGYCTCRGFDFEKIVQETWNQVKQRDWKKDPDTAHIGKGDT